MMKVFIATSSFATYSNEPLEILTNNGISFELNYKGRKLSPKEVEESLMGFDGIIAGTELYSKDILKESQNLKVISRLGVGVDNIDLSQAKDLGIKVFKTKTTPSIAVAELTIGLILNLLRKVTAQNNQLKNGEWEKHMGELLSGKTLGIVGLGNIGKQLVQVLAGFNVKVIAYDLYTDEEFADRHNVKFVDFNKLLQQSDIISIHLNLTKDTNQFFDYSVFKKMKKNAIIINTSRGEVINEDDLLKALDQKLIQGAGLDVFENEPYGGPLLKHKNVILTPHIGSYAKEVRIQMELEAAENVILGLGIG